MTSTVWHFIGLKLLRSPHILLVFALCFSQRQMSTMINNETFCLAVWPAANGFKLFQASRLGKLRAWGSWLGLGVKMKAAEELRTCSAGKTFYTFNEAAATSRHTPQSLRLAIFLFLRFRKGHLENLSWLMKTELIIVTKITNITNYICGEKIVMWRNFGRFCHNLRAFMWRKIEPKKYICGEKNTNIRSESKYSPSST